MKIIFRQIYRWLVDQRYWWILRYILRCCIGGEGMNPLHSLSIATERNSIDFSLPVYLLLCMKLVCKTRSTSNIQSTGRSHNKKRVGRNLLHSGRAPDTKEDFSLPIGSIFKLCLLRTYLHLDDASHVKRFEL